MTDDKQPEGEAASAAAQTESNDSGASGKGSPPIVSAAVCAVVGLVAGGIGVALMNNTGEVFVLPKELRDLSAGRFPSGEEQERIVAGYLVAGYKNTALWMSMIGAVLGGLVGLAAALLRSSKSQVLVATVVALVVGGAFGGLSGLTAVKAEAMAQAGKAETELNLPEHYVLMLHAATWCVMGLGVGLGVGLFRQPRTPSRIAEAAIITGLAGMVAGVLFPVLGGIIFPATDPTLAVPIDQDPTGRFFWGMLPGAIIGFAAGRQK